MKKKIKKGICPLHKYQLGIILVFTAGFLLLFPYYLLMLELEIDISKWQWYFLFPWMIFYISYMASLRSKISKRANITAKKFPIVHWVFLGIAIIAFNIGMPLRLDRLYGIDSAFIIFSLFLADSFWDFKSFYRLHR